jgi:hypothetical protein
MLHNSPIPHNNLNYVFPSTISKNGCCQDHQVCQRWQIQCQSSVFIFFDLAEVDSLYHFLLLETLFCLNFQEHESDFLFSFWVLGFVVTFMTFYDGLSQIFKCLRTPSEMSFIFTSLIQ